MFGKELYSVRFLIQLGRGWCRISSGFCVRGFGSARLWCIFVRGAVQETWFDWVRGSVRFCVQFGSGFECVLVRIRVRFGNLR